MKYVVKVPYMSAQGLHSYYTVSTREEAEYIAKQCLNAEILEIAEEKR